MKARRYLAIVGSLTKAKTTSKLRFDLSGLKNYCVLKRLYFLVTRFSRFYTNLDIRLIHI